MFERFILIASLSLVTAYESYYITKVNETVHHNVVLDNDLPWIPEMYAKKVILNNLTGSITSQSFSVLTELEEMYIAHSNIDNIHEDAFKVFPKLKILQFSYNNHLPILRNEIFQNCKTLEKIIIGHNVFVEGIAENLFSNLQNVTEIEVTKENKIPRHLTYKFFENSKTLKSLKLHFSNITTIHSEAFDGLNGITFLSFAENDLVAIGPQAFKSEHLVHLYLGWNKLKLFSGEEISKLTNLKSIDLSFNPLKEVNLELVRRNAPNLQWLAVVKSSLSCDNKRELMKQTGRWFNVRIDPMEIEKCEV